MTGGWNVKAFSPMMNRRDLLRAAVSGAGAITLGALLAACGGETTAPPTPTVTPSGNTAASPPTAASSGTASTPAPSSVMASGAAAAPATGGQVSVFWQKTPTTLQPLFTTTGAEQQVERALFGTLVKVNDKLEPVPDLAEKVESSPDATAYTFTLRDGITFTDGTPLTARDVAFTIERAVDRRTGSPWRARLLAIAGAAEYGDQKADTISGLQATDDRTVTIRLAQPDAAFLVTLGNFSGLGILPAHVLKDVPPDQLQSNPFSLSPNVTAGAFQFVQYRPSQFLEMKRNENYGGGPKAKLDRVFFKLLAPQTALAQLGTGELDLMLVPLQEVANVRKNPEVIVVSTPSPSITRINVNNNRPYFKDKRVRQAMMYALDREGIAKQLFSGEVQVVNTPIIGPDWMGTPAGLNDYPFNPDKAKQLLKDANWDPGRTVELIFPVGDTESGAAAPIIQQQCKEVGIQLTLAQLEPAAYNQKYTQTDNFDLFLFGGGTFRSDPSVSAQFLATASIPPAGQNGARYRNPQVDALYKQGQTTTDQAARKKIYTQAAQILNDEVPLISLWSPNTIFAFNKRLQGFRAPSYMDNVTWAVEEWSVTR